MDSNIPTYIRPTDIGSFPLMGINQEEYILGAADLEDGTTSEAATYFVKQHNEAFKHKVAALGPEESVPCYVQSSVGRDMLSQFLDQLNISFASLWL